MLSVPGLAIAVRDAGDGPQGMMLAASAELDYDYRDLDAHRRMIGDFLSRVLAQIGRDTLDLRVGIEPRKLLVEKWTVDQWHAGQWIWRIRHPVSSAIAGRNRRASMPAIMFAITLARKRGRR